MSKHIRIILFFYFVAISNADVDQDLINNEIGTRDFVFWPNATIPFYIETSHFDHEQALVIMRTLADIAFRTCIKFAPVLTPPEGNIHVLRFINPSGLRHCSIDPAHSVDDTHQVILGYECLKTPYIERMILRTLGLPFEHNRPIRDVYIDILYENIESGYVALFNKEVKLPEEFQGLPYDINSVMHFGEREFTRNGHRTLIFKEKDQKQRRDGLTTMDVRKLDIIYGPECRKRDRLEKIELCQSYPGVARRKRDISEPLSNVSLRVNRAITVPPGAFANSETIFKDFGVADEVQKLVDQIHKITSLALQHVRAKYCNEPNNGTVPKSNIAVVNDSSDILGVINVIAEFTRSIVEHATSNKTAFCALSSSVVEYQRVRCIFGENNCPEKYRSTKSGAVRYSTQHRPYIVQSTNHEGPGKRNVYERRRFINDTVTEPSRNKRNVDSNSTLVTPGKKDALRKNTFIDAIEAATVAQPVEKSRRKREVESALNGNKPELNEKSDDLPKSIVPQRRMFFDRQNRRQKGASSAINWESSDDNENRNVHGLRQGRGQSIEENRPEERRGEGNKRGNSPYDRGDSLNKDSIRQTNIMNKQSFDKPSKYFSGERNPTHSFSQNYNRKPNYPNIEDQRLEKRRPDPYSDHKSGSFSERLPTEIDNKYVLNKEDYKPHSNREDRVDIREPIDERWPPEVEVETRPLNIEAQISHPLHEYRKPPIENHRNLTRQVSVELERAPFINREEHTPLAEDSKTLRNPGTVPKKYSENREFGNSDTWKDADLYRHEEIHSTIKEARNNDPNDELRNAQRFSTGYKERDSNFDSSDLISPSPTENKDKPSRFEDRKRDLQEQEPRDKESHFPPDVNVEVNKPYHKDSPRISRSGEYPEEHKKVVPPRDRKNTQPSYEKDQLFETLDKEQRPNESNKYKRSGEIKNEKHVNAFQGENRRPAINEGDKEFDTFSGTDVRDRLPAKKKLKSARNNSPIKNILRSDYIGGQSHPPVKISDSQEPSKMYNEASASKEIPQKPQQNLQDDDEKKDLETIREKRHDQDSYESYQKSYNHPHRFDKQRHRHEQSREHIQKQSRERRPKHHSERRPKQSRERWAKHSRERWPKESREHKQQSHEYRPETANEREYKQDYDLRETKKQSFREPADIPEKENSEEYKRPNSEEVYKDNKKKRHRIEGETHKKREEYENTKEVKGSSAEVNRPSDHHSRPAYRPMSKETEHEREEREPKPRERKESAFAPKTVTLNKKNREFYDDRKWPDGVIRFVISPLEYDLEDMRRRIAEVNKLLKLKTCTRLEEITEEDTERFEDYLVLDASPDYVTGRVGGRQKFGVLELFEGGQHRQHAAMVVMAMLGFYFEVARHDRDKYIRVHMRHIRPDKMHHFEKIRDDATLDLPYDYKSAAHPAWQFWRHIGRTGISTVATFKDKDPSGAVMKSLGQNEELLSELDIIKINSVYGTQCFETRKSYPDVDVYL